MDEFDANMYITQRYFYGYAHSDVTNDRIEDEFVGLPSDPYLEEYNIPISSKKDKVNN